MTENVTTWGSVFPTLDYLKFFKVPRVIRYRVYDAHFLTHDYRGQSMKGPSILELDNTLQKGLSKY